MTTTSGPARLTLIEACAAPEPPYPGSVRSNGWSCDLDVQRIKQSDTWTLAPADMRPWLLMLWVEAWQSVPCGSMPATDELIAARIGMDARLFAANRDVLLRGWRLHSDGRLYHTVITERVLAMLSKRRATAERVGKWRERKHAPAVADATDNANERVSNALQRVSNALTLHDSTTTCIATAYVDSTTTRSATAELETRTGADAPAPAPKKVQTRGVRLFSPFALPDEWRDWTRSERPDLDADAVAQEFADYWHAQPGQRGVKVDWFATWRNWCRREKQRPANIARSTPEAFSRPARGDALLQRNAAVASRFLDRLRGGASPPAAATQSRDATMEIIDDHDN